MEEPELEPEAEADEPLDDEDEVEDVLVEVDLRLAELTVPLVPEEVPLVPEEPLPPELVPVAVGPMSGVTNVEFWPAGTIAAGTWEVTATG